MQTPPASLLHPPTPNWCGINDKGSSFSAQRMAGPVWAEAAALCNPSRWFSSWTRVVSSCADAGQHSANWGEGALCRVLECCLWSSCLSGSLPRELQSFWLPRPPSTSRELRGPARLCLMALPCTWWWANLVCFSCLRNHCLLLMSHFWKSSFHGFRPLFSTSHLDWKWKSLYDPMGFSPLGFSVHGDSPGKNIEVGCHALLQGIFPTQGSNPRLPHCRQILYLSHQGSPQIYYLYSFQFT